MSAKSCFLCGGKTKRVKSGVILDPCGQGDPLYKCTECGVEYFSAKTKRQIMR